MRSPICLGLPVLVGLALGPRAWPADDSDPPKDARADAKLLQGSWKVIALEADGIKAPADALRGMRWSFRGTEVQFINPGEATPGKSSVKLDPGQTPKRIDLVNLDGPQKGKSIQGIYKLEKDRLVICLRGAEAATKVRPKEFTTEPDSGLGMITLERLKE